jgi:hypothetical protein
VRESARRDSAAVALPYPAQSIGRLELEAGPMHPPSPHRYQGDYVAWSGVCGEELQFAALFGLGISVGPEAIELVLQQPTEASTAGGALHNQDLTPLVRGA